MSPLRRLRPVTAVTRITLALSVFAVTACEDEITDPGDEVVEGEVMIDASSQTAFSYFTFSDGGSVVSVTDPASSTDWDMAFRRFSVKLNGGVSGPGDVSGVNLSNNASLDSAAVLALAAADGDAAFEAVTAASIAGATFSEDALVEETTAWLTFGQMGPMANPSAAWRIRLADGEYAVFRAIAFTFGGSATFEVRHQTAGGTLTAIDTVTADVSMGPAWIDLESGATVGPMGCIWDISVSPGAGLTVNDTCNVGTFPLDTGDDFSSMTNADDAPEYGAFLSAPAGAFPSTVDDAAGSFWYNIDGSNFLFPTYNVYLVRVGTAVYKVQLIDYYDAAGASGFPTIRFELL